MTYLESSYLPAPLHAAAVLPRHVPIAIINYNRVRDYVIAYYLSTVTSVRTPTLGIIRRIN